MVKDTLWLVFTLPGILISLFRAKALNALILGDELPTASGSLPQGTVHAFVAVGLMTAASVSLGGMIRLRRSFGPSYHQVDNRFGQSSACPLIRIGGGGLLCIADLISRSVLAQLNCLRAS